LAKRMEGSLWELLIPFWSVNKHGRHRQFLFLIGWFLKQLFLNKNCLWQPYLLMDQDEMSNLYRGPPMDASYQVLVHLAKRFQWRRFRNLVGSIYGRFSIKSVHFLSIH
jgi:hypothetical protein